MMITIMMMRAEKQSLMLTSLERIIRIKMNFMIIKNMMKLLTDEIKTTLLTIWFVKMRAHPTIHTIMTTLSTMTADKWAKKDNPRPFLQKLALINTRVMMW